MYQVFTRAHRQAREQMRSNHARFRTCTAPETVEPTPSHHKQLTTYTPRPDAQPHSFLSATGASTCCFTPKVTVYTHATILPSYHHPQLYQSY